MHTLMSNQQYYEALGSSTIVNKEGLNSKWFTLAVLGFEAAGGGSDDYF